MIPKTINTTCAYCGVGCGIQAEVDGNTRNITILGDENHPANFGKLCSKGTSLGDTVSLDGRLLQPEVNGDVCDWDHALETVAQGFKQTIAEHGPDSVAFYLSGQLLTEDYYVANKLMKGFIGSANIDTNSRLCMSSSVSGHKRAFGNDTVPGCYDDFEHAELITLVGSNTAWCHPVLFQRIRRYKAANPHVKVVVIDPRRTQTCDIADLHLPLALGTDSWLFNGLLSFLAEHKHLNQSYIDQYCEGFDQALKAAQASAATVNDTAHHCDVSPDDIAQFFSWFAAHEKSVTLYSQGVNQSSSGTDKVNSLINCHLATGRIGREGMGPFSVTGQPNAMGGREVGGLASTLASHMEFTTDNIDRIGRFWKTDTVAKQPGLTAVDLFNAIDEGKVKAVWIIATNPVVSLPNADKAKAALEKCPLVVVSDCVANTDTLRLAHVKLPATGWSEKNGTVTNSERRISRQRHLFSSAGEAQHDWWIITQIAQRMGYHSAFNYQHPRDIFTEHAALSGFENTPEGCRRDFDISALETLTEQQYDALTPTQWPITKAYPNGRQRFFSTGDFYTDNRKARLIPITPRLPFNAPDKQYPLRLNTGRIRDQWHTMTRTALAPQLNQHIQEPFVELHPRDAAARQFQDKQLLNIHSRWGKVCARLTISDTIRPGECFIPMHWTGELSRHGRVGAVVNPAVDPTSLQPESKHTPVQLSPYACEWHGVILQRHKNQWPDCDYVVEVTGEQHQLLILAGQQPIAAHTAIKQLKQWTSLNDDWEILSYQDLALGHYRLAAIDKNGQLQALALLSKQFDLPPTTWLGLQFMQATLDTRTRNALLSGRAPAGEDIGRIVCACFSVGEKTISQAIHTHGFDTVDAVGQCLKAGTNCGSCVPEIKQLLEKA